MRLARIPALRARPTREEPEHCKHLAKVGSGRNWLQLVFHGIHARMSFPATDGAGVDRTQRRPIAISVASTSGRAPASSQRHRHPPSLIPVRYLKGVFCKPKDGYLSKMPRPWSWHHLNEMPAFSVDNPMFFFLRFAECSFKMIRIRLHLETSANQRQCTYVQCPESSVHERRVPGSACW